jgi:CubicO group peptidase (beta-lactamase class C family)
VAPDRGHEIWSGTKSFNGLILAAAVQDGLLTLDEPVSRTLPEWRSDPAKAAVTLRQLLSLTSGLRSTVGRAPDYAEAIAAPLAAAPGTRFQYGATPFQVFGEVMQRKLAAAGREPDVLAYLKSRILDPIDAHWSDWRRTPAGDALLPQGAVFTAREWAKFGEFVRAGGSVGGKPLVDQAAFAQLFKGSAVNPAYGLSWWLPAATNQPDVVTARLDPGRPCRRPAGRPGHRRGRRQPAPVCVSVLRSDHRAAGDVRSGDGRCGHAARPTHGPTTRSSSPCSTPSVARG